MKNQAWKSYAAFILLCEAVGALAGWLTADGVKYFSENVRQPVLTPPNALFPAVWGVLFALMGVSAARVYRANASAERARGLRLFGVQLAFNFFWSLIYFNFRQYAFAFVWLLALWGLILWMILTFRAVDRPAAYLQIPYLLWVAFAGYLNLGVWLLNQ